MGGPRFVVAWEKLANETAATHGLPGDLVLAMIWQESAGKPWSYRFEPAFWDRYLAGKPAWTRGLTGGALELWTRRCSASYGLLQVMYPVAVELGLPVQAEPEILFEPRTSLSYGCRKLSREMKRGPDERTAIRRYNGAGPAAERYVAEVLAKREQLGA